jgi:hypothetical protein
MPKLCNYLNCRKRASYGLTRNCPVRCKQHKEDYKSVWQICGCGKAQPIYNEVGETAAICCALCKTDTMIDVKNKKCRCGNARPHFNEPGETTAVCCASCKTDAMINVTNKKCECGKAQPIFNEVGETIPICCASCKTDTMIDVKNKKCLCGKVQALFNEPGETSAVCCASCKTDTMINVINKKCRCGKARPNFNEQGEPTAICCAYCKTDTMIDVQNKKCQCGKARPSYNESGETSALCCASCKTDTMVNVTNKKCRCGKTQPHYNEIGETPAVCCSSCKTDTMIDVKNKRCRCGKSRPHFNEPGEPTAVCCASCKTDTMVNVISKICPGLINGNIPCPFRSCSNYKYKNYCTECFRRNFPLDPLTFQIRSKTKEFATRDYINANYDGFQHDRILETGHCDCTIKRRIDHRKLIGNTLLVIETDENQHKSYDKMDEETRYDDLYMAHSGKWVYIRFNPDKYINQNGIRKNPTIAARLNVLKDEIDKQINRIEDEENTELVERIYLYYDGYN